MTTTIDSIWSAEHRSAAREEGWELTFTVDEGKPVQSAYLHIFNYGPKFNGRNEAAAHVLRAAQGGSKLHIRALSACQATRAGAGMKGKR